LARAIGSNVARTLGLNPNSFMRTAMGFLITAESQGHGFTLWF